VLNPAVNRVAKNTLLPVSSARENSWDMEEWGKMLIDAFTYIGSVAGILIFTYTLFKDFILKKPSLIFHIECAKIIEDYPGELGIQVDAEIKARNGYFFLKNIELNNFNKVVYEKAEIKADIRKYLKEDLIQKYLDDQRNKITSAKKEKQKLDQFEYYIRCKSGGDYKVDDLGNPVIPDIRSDFEKSFPNLIQRQVYRESRYEAIAENIPSLLNLRVDDQSIYSLSLFFHAYGEFDDSLGKRESLPLNDWYIILMYSEGKIKKKLNTKTISYSQVKNFIDEGKAT
jgi:hypothetical protein